MKRGQRSESRKRKIRKEGIDPTKPTNQPKKKQRSFTCLFRATDGSGGKVADKRVAKVRTNRNLSIECSSKV